MAKRIWLDCDPGHDDATAIMLAVHCTNIQLLGISTVHGNASSENINGNAARCLYAFNAPENVRVYPGATKPLIRPTRHDPEIHGDDGLGGVEGLPPATLLAIRERIIDNGSMRAIEAIAQAAREVRSNGQKLTVLSSGPMTNIALFVSVYPDLLDCIEEFVFMGGGVGVGNRSASAEFNILCDPEAAQIVLDAPVKKTMIPLNVTHTAIVTQDVFRHLLSPALPSTAAAAAAATDAAAAADADIGAAPRPATPSALRHMLFTLLSFFADAYKSTFGFADGPPIHDALTVAYVSRPDLFRCTRYRVDVELNGAHTVGETVVDVWNYRSCDDSWGRTGKNCLVAEKLDVPGFFDLFLECIARCDAVSPLNQ